MLSQILSIITPVLLIILVGYAARLYRPIELSTINHLNIDLFCPLLVYSTLSNSTLSITTLGPLVMATLLIVVGSGVLAWFVTKVFHLPVAAVTPTSMFNNCGNMGLPLGFFAAGQAGLDVFISLFVISNALHFTLGVWVIGAPARFRAVLLSPMMIATYLGLIANIFHWSLPLPIEQSIKMLGDITIPLMLFALGVRMADVNLSHLGIGLFGGVLCPLTGLIIALGIAPVLSLQGLDWQMLFLFAVLPPAVLNFMIAEKYAIEPESVASIVIIGNILALVFVPIGLWIGLMGG